MLQALGCRPHLLKLCVSLSTEQSSQAVDTHTKVLHQGSPLVPTPLHPGAGLLVTSMVTPMGAPPAAPEGPPGTLLVQTPLHLPPSSTQGCG